MAESSVNVTEGSGKRLHTSDRTISAVLVQDQFVLPGEYPYASYVALAPAVSIATINDHVIQLMAGSTNHVRIRRIRLEQRAAAGTAAASVIEIWRLTTAGTGGTAITPAKFDSSDAASGATAMSLPTAKGTEATLLLAAAQSWRQAVSATGSPADDQVYEWVQHPGMKPLIIPAGTSNGIALKSTTAIASCTVIATIEYVETSFL